MARSSHKKNCIEKIQNKKQRNVKFSKRRTGLFKKESELSTLCDSLSAMVIVNPPTNIDGTNSDLTVPRENDTRKVNSELIQINKMLEEEHKRIIRLNTGRSYENFNSL
ncbi:hypothetical protein R3W88_015910 [Solanum pinnatisectum]|uniref:MADS-box domain-containing protein n=1 Tax=Solanum pinnatisectum TaxID=50273 RepID=A0AAV9KX07_9SOLN|nr:hypothetical protein R3W88_015910 [Solanum pinnatisectum]